MAKNDGLSDSELARRTGQSPQNLHKKMKNNTWKQADIEHIAGVLGCYVSIRLIDGTGKVVAECDSRPDGPTPKAE